jgi:plasmid stability protein
MTSITIHNLDDALAALLRAKARADGTSLNQAIKRLLEGALGARPSTTKHRKEFAKFCGVWSKAQAAEFDKAVVADLEKADAGDWR